MSKPKEPLPLYFKTLEPVHVGAGGYRLGRVDKTICREPGTNLPKIPGTSLSGAARSYAAMLFGKTEAAGAIAVYKPDRDKTCPIFYTFGHASAGGDGNAGSVSIGDASLLFFPIYSTGGRVWISAKSWLERAGCDVESLDMAAGVRFPQGRFGYPGFNLGWAWFRVADPKAPAPNQPPPSTLECDMETLLAPIPQHARPESRNVVLVSDELIASLVNSGLEVRTSVSIDPGTGTASATKLFSYEAIPRDTYLFQEVVIEEYRDPQHHFPVPGKPEWIGPESVLLDGLRQMAILGVGGMGTRGFGRLRLLEGPAEPEVKGKETPNAGRAA